MFEGSLIAAGITISYWLDLGFSFLDPSSVAWRFPIAFQNVFALIILIFVLPLPESPRWLILKGREQEALDVLAAILDLDENDPYVHSEFSAIKDAVLAASSVSFRDLLTMDENRHFHRVVLAYVNQMFQQISGINLITYYAAFIYENSLGMDGLTSRILAACNGTEYFLASLVPIFIIEKVGRRVLMLVGAAGMSISMAVLAITTSFEGETKPGIAAAVFLFVFNTFFALGWLGMTWLYPAEIVRLSYILLFSAKAPTNNAIGSPSNPCSCKRTRHFGQLDLQLYGCHGHACCVRHNQIQDIYYLCCHVSILWAKCVLCTTDSLPNSNAFIFPVVYFFYPETAYRSLEEMDTIFHKTSSIFNAVSVARNEPHRYGKKGELLINYEETEEHLRRASYVSEKKIKLANEMNDMETGKGTHVEHRKDSSSNSSQTP